MGGFGIAEMVVIFILAIVIYGKNLPEVARNFARWYTKIRRQLTDILLTIQRGHGQEAAALEYQSGEAVDAEFEEVSAEPSNRG